MVNFVKPNLLGNIKEFKNRFENIINKGKTVDATRQDVLLMRRRCHVLHERLRGILDRRDYTVLKDSLPPKHEYVIMIRLTQVTFYEILIGKLNSFSPKLNCIDNFWNHLMRTENMDAFWSRIM